MNLPNDISSRPTDSTPSPEDARPLLAKVAVGLAVLTFLIFLPVVSMNWVNFDDDVFVTNNPHVAGGFTWEGIIWAFSSADIDYWRPLSWLSHMLDMELFGPVAGLHHLSSLLIHIAGTVMLLLALHRLTGAIWPSAMVAALFAWHPLHVESVAWIAERKDVLCGFFWFYTIWAYAGYVREPTSANYLRAFFGFVLGAMSKPMVVTLPCTLLLLDWWPLRRFEEGAGWRTFAQTAGRLIWEKAPFFGVVAVMCFSTVFAQHRIGAMSDFGHLPIMARLPSVLAAYGTYLWQTVWPANLCVLYPHTVNVPLWKWLGSVVVLGGITTIAVLRAWRQPFLSMGWLWFLGVLVPVIGLVQVGEQAHADRYTYIPLVGLFVVVTWTVAAWAGARAGRARWARWAAVGVLLACAVVARAQLRHWENSVTLFTRAVSVTTDNVTALNNLGAELRSIGKLREAADWLEKGARIRPTQGTMFNLALSYSDLGDPVKARFFIYQAFRLGPRGKLADGLYEMLEEIAQERPNDSDSWQMLAVAAQVRGDNAAAAKHLAELIRTDPQNVDARIDRAAHLALIGDETGAFALLEAAVARAPTNSLARGNLAALLAKQGRLADARPHYEFALKTTPDNPDLRHNYALLLSRSGKPAEARREFEAILKSHPNHVPALQQLAWLLATRPELRNGPEARRLAQSAAELSPVPTPLLLDIMAAAGAAVGDFNQAITHATSALDLARAANLRELEDAIRARLALYKAGKPYTVDSSANKQP